MINNIESIYSDYRLTYVNTPDFTIDFYEKKSIFFNNIGQFKNKDELKLYIEIISKYAEAIYQKNRFNLAIDIIDEKQTFIDEEIQRLNANEIKDVWYFDLSFVKGMASYKLKDYKTATPIFKNLVLIDSQNDMFKRWLIYSEYGQRLWITNAINIICAALVLGEIFYKSLIPNYYLRQTLLVIGVLGFTINLGYEYYIKRNFRKTSKN